MLECSQFMASHINLNPYPLKLYGSVGGTHQDLSGKVAKLLKTKLSPIVYREFKNGEFIVHHAESVRDRDVYLIFQPRFSIALSNICIRSIIIYCDWNYFRGNVFAA